MGQVKRILEGLIDYFAVHGIVVLSINFTAFILYLTEYGWASSTTEIMEQVAKNNLAIIVLLSIYVIYPLLWAFLYAYLYQTVKTRRVVTFTIASFLLGLIPTAAFVGFDMFFNFRYGAFPFVVGFFVAPLVYFGVKESITKKLKVPRSADTKDSSQTFGK